MAFVRVPLHSKKYPNLFTLVDADDYVKVEPYKWHPMKQDGEIYAGAAMYVEGKRRMIKMHRFILDVWDASVLVAHDNHDGLDNRRENLWAGTIKDIRVHTRNKRPKAKNPYRGVSPTRASTWVVRIVGVNLGTYGDPVQAARVYDAAARMFHGHRALLNFPDIDSTEEDMALLNKALAGPVYFRPFRGLKWNYPRRKWEVRIKKNGDEEYLGIFSDPIDAAKVYDRRARELFGADAILNFGYIE